MSAISLYKLPDDLLLGRRLNSRVPWADQLRQRAEVEEILTRLNTQPGVVLADEVGMGKTFVALAIAYCEAVRSPWSPVIVMAPANLIDKWIQDLRVFCELYLENRDIVDRDKASRKSLTDAKALRYGVARHSVELMKLLDDPQPQRCHLIFVAQGAMSRRQSDKWIRLALIAEALRRHGRGKASRLIQVKRQIHRFLGKLLWAVGEERAHNLRDELWQALLQTDPTAWKRIYNEAAQDERRLADDPVPKLVTRALSRTDIKSLAAALEHMPVRARGGDARITKRLAAARKALREVEENLWKQVLAQISWKSSLLVMDEAHHLKNPGTLLARQLHSPESDQDLRTGDGAMANAFNRMLFLTATPFQLGHRELVHVLERFGDVQWDADRFGSLENFRQQLKELSDRLNESQRTAIALRQAWEQLQPEDCANNVDAWWDQLCQSPRESLNHRQGAVIDAHAAAKQRRDAAEKALQPWVVRHGKGTYWADTKILRRQRMEGAAISGNSVTGGLLIPSQQLLPFFLAARSAVNPGIELLGEALCSSYEAFRFTRNKGEPAKDEADEPPTPPPDLAHSSWYLEEFDRTLAQSSGSTHPKISATVHRVVDLWETGEKVLVFAFYRHTCRALRIHISQEIEKRVIRAAQRQLQHAGREVDPSELNGLLDRIQKRYFDDTRSSGRRALDRALARIVEAHKKALDNTQVSSQQREKLVDVMRRFLRVSTTLARYFPIAEFETIKPLDAITKTLNVQDASGLSWRQKFDGFISFLTERCASEAERDLYLEAARHTQTGGIRVEDEDEGNRDEDQNSSRVTLANVQVATGTTHRETRSRLMQAFNTPFFPDILVCSEVMGEGVDLQRFCRHVIHHDLAWNPSTIEQRTGRIDRLGCKAEGRQPIAIYLPYLAGTADERQYQVMIEREKWFRVVMGEDAVARLIAPDSVSAIPLPSKISEQLHFHLSVSPDRAKDETDSGSSIGR